MRNLNNSEAKLISGAVYVAPSVNNPNAWFLDLCGDSEFRFSPDRINAYVFNQTGAYFSANGVQTLITNDNMNSFGVASLDYIGSPFKQFSTGIYVVEFI